MLPLLLKQESLSSGLARVCDWRSFCKGDVKRGDSKVNELQQCKTDYSLKSNQGRNSRNQFFPLRRTMGGPSRDNFRIGVLQLRNPGAEARTRMKELAAQIVRGGDT